MQYFVTFGILVGILLVVMGLVIIIEKLSNKENFSNDVYGDDEVVSATRKELPKGCGTTCGCSIKLVDCNIPTSNTN